MQFLTRIANSGWGADVDQNMANKILPEKEVQDLCPYLREVHSTGGKGMTSVGDGCSRIARPVSLDT
jgi:hypothetical protein